MIGWPRCVVPSPGLPRSCSPPPPSAPSRARHRAADLPLTGHVNPFIGTDDSNSPNPVGGGAGGSTFPGATVPFGMVQFSPDTPTASPSGLPRPGPHDRVVQPDPLQRRGLPQQRGPRRSCRSPGTSAPRPAPPGPATRPAYTKSNETAAPGYYRNRLDQYGTDVELSATKRTGALRLTYPATTTARVLINASRCATGNRRRQRHHQRQPGLGRAHRRRVLRSAETFQIYYSIQFDRAPTGVGTFKGGTVSAGSSTTSGTQHRRLRHLRHHRATPWSTRRSASRSSAWPTRRPTPPPRPASLRRRSASNADAAWNTALNRVQVTGGASADLQKFYTALYHVLQNPNIASDVNGQYRGFDNAVHTASHPIYQNYSGWDIYRSWASLVALIAPDVMTDIVKSMILDGQQGGLLPKWSHQSNEDFVMTGDPGPDHRGQRVRLRRAQLRHRGRAGADEEELQRRHARRASSMRGQPVRSTTPASTSRATPRSSLEYAASDFAIAQFARALGDTAGVQHATSTRAQCWRNVFNGESSYIHTRNADGSWPWPLDPATERRYIEGNAAQYTWMVTAQPRRADQPDGRPGHRDPAARPPLHRAQRRADPAVLLHRQRARAQRAVDLQLRPQAGRHERAVRRVMAESFTTGAGGLPGNDDLGATSAWYVWAALGMYPVTPGADTLALHGPLFPAALIQRAERQHHRSTAAARANRYVQSLARQRQPRSAATSCGTARSAAAPRSPSPWAARPGSLGHRRGRRAAVLARRVRPSRPRHRTSAPNLALGKTVTGSAACGAAEAAGKAVDGLIRGNSKWCSTAAPREFLQVDLGSAQNVSVVRGQARRAGRREHRLEHRRLQHPRPAPTTSPAPRR